MIDLILPLSLIVLWQYLMSNDDYKAVVFSGNELGASGVEIEVQVYTLRTASWRRIEGFCHYRLDNKGKYLNGALHWTACRESNFTAVIVSVDLMKETHGEILEPDYQDVTYRRRLDVLNGCLCILCSYHDHGDVWVMKEYGTRESWTKLVVIPYVKHPWDCLDPDPDPVFILKNGEGSSGVGDVGFSVTATVGGGKEEEFTALAIVANAERMCSRRGRSLIQGGLCRLRQRRWGRSFVVATAPLRSLGEAVGSGWFSMVAILCPVSSTAAIVLAIVLVCGEVLGLWLRQWRGDFVVFGVFWMMEGQQVVVTVAQGQLGEVAAVGWSLVRAILLMGYAQSGCSLVFRWCSSGEEAEEMLVGVVDFFLGSALVLGKCVGNTGAWVQFEF
ncbi:hypothetical protein Vadar_003727 [Vaccinium darrowii]|uniref:Uncharacterized protein n=1 Tax=Vaccinium darrowii TaxID=229202 RepID=A0ACB7YT53_9ERIC|nr:hypothetical protein Vadar_003727 [Vaccinium darrowii]